MTDNSSFSKGEHSSDSDLSGTRRRLLLMLAAGAVLLVLGIWQGRHITHRLPEIENWISAHGFLGWAAFVAGIVVLTSMFVPTSVFAIFAGVLFGMGGGTSLMVLAALITALLNFVISRVFLRSAVRHWLDRSPKLAAIERAVNHEGLRFQFLLRLTPLSPVTVSYVLGATNTRFLTFMTASLGMIPTLFVEVYFGAAARHIANASEEVHHHGGIKTALTVVGLLLSVGLLVYVARLALRAVARHEEAAEVAEAID